MRKRKRLKTATTLSCFSLRVRPARFLACLATLLITSASVEGRQPPKPKDYALIFGTVWGPDERPVAGVKVKIRTANEKKPHWEIYSNLRGEFEQRVPVGKQDYVIWADLKGYKPPVGKHLQAGPEVTVHIESNERADTGLHLK
jgi:hypothetical protein